MAFRIDFVSSCGFLAGVAGVLVGVLAGSGCVSTGTLYPPCAERNLGVFPKEYFGEWTMRTSSGEAACGLRISPCEGRPGIARIEVLEERGGGERPGRSPLPFLAGAFRAGSVRFLQIGLDIEAVLAAGRFSREAAVFVKPVHFVCEARTDAEGRPEWDFVTFLRQRPGERPGDLQLEPIDPALLYGKDDHLILNPTPELRSLLGKGRYGIALKTILIPRK